MFFGFGYEIQNKTYLYWIPASFIMDIIKEFITGFIASGNIVIKHKEIAKKYL